MTASPASRTIKVKGVDADQVSDAQLEEAFGEFGPLRRCFLIRGKKRGRDAIAAAAADGYVEFALAEDAQKCLEEAGGEIDVQGLKVKVESAPDKGSVRVKTEPGVGEEHSKPDVEELRRQRKAGKAKKARLIVRNVSFKSTEAQLRAHFEKVGAVTEVNILTRPDGRRVGCAFVQMGEVGAAAKAIRELNGKEVGGRRVAVDWAVGRKEYQDKQGKEEGEEGVKTEVKEEPQSDTEGTEMDGQDEDSGGDDDDESEEESEDEDGEDDEGEDESESPAKKDRPHWTPGHDIGEKLTVFVRNLSFDSGEEDLAALCRERFGAVHFAKVVVDRDTGHPRGTAFVKFREVDAARAMVEASKGDEGLVLDDRRIYAVEAITKAEADEAYKQKKEKEKKDSRNLHLATEGLVRKGTQAAIGVSDADMQKRVQVERWKRGMLKDLNMFISPFRLCVRNLPDKFTDRDLKKLAVTHCDRSARITEAKVIIDRRAGGGGKAKQNKGYGFVTFARHEDALQMLRKLNNNPAIFSAQSRPIVEFSVENRKAVNARQKRLAKSRENNPNFRKGQKLATDANSDFKKKKEKEEPQEKMHFMGAINNPKNTKMPSHIGEKVRHNRPRAITRKDLRKAEQLRKHPKKAKRKMEQQVKTEPAGDPPTKKAKQSSEGNDGKKTKTKKKAMNKAARSDWRDEKQFTAMVEKYKSRMSATSSGKGQAPQIKTKWFEQ